MAKRPPLTGVMYLLVDDKAIPLKDVPKDVWLEAESRMMKRVGRVMSEYYQRQVDEGKITVEFID